MPDLWLFHMQTYVIESYGHFRVTDNSKSQAVSGLGSPGEERYILANPAKANPLVTHPVSLNFLSFPLFSWFSPISPISAIFSFLGQFLIIFAYFPQSFGNFGQFFSFLTHCLLGDQNLSFFIVRSPLHVHV